MSAQDCLNAIRAAAGEISDDEILEIAEAIQRKRKALAAEGRLAGIDAALAEAAAEEGKKARLAAALVRKHAALNAVVRDRLQRQVEGLASGGMSHRDAVRAVLIGSTKGIGSARVSVAAKRLAYEGRYLGEMFAHLERDRPHVRRMLDDPKLWDDTLRELYELREGVCPGRRPSRDRPRVTARRAGHPRACPPRRASSSDGTRSATESTARSTGRSGGWRPGSTTSSASSRSTASARPRTAKGRSTASSAGTLGSCGRCKAG